MALFQNKSEVTRYTVLVPSAASRHSSSMGMYDITFAQVPVEIVVRPT